MRQSVHFVGVGILSASLSLAGGCGESTPLAPTPPPSGPILSTLLVTGSVSLATFQACRDCTVEVLDGPGAGRSVLTDANGGFTFSIAGSAPTLRASKDGYRSLTKVATPTGTGGAWVSFRLESVQPPLDLAGTYTMTFVAGCEEVPAEIRRRDYVVLLLPSAEHPQTMFVARPVEGRFDVFQMGWGVSGNEVAMVAPGGDTQDPGVAERLENGTVELRLAARPQVMTTTTSMRIEVSGQFSYCTGNSALGCTVCDGASHLLTMTRR